MRNSTKKWSIKKYVYKEKEKKYINYISKIYWIKLLIKNIINVKRKKSKKNGQFSS